MIPGDIPTLIVLFWLFVFGAVVGSFLNVCIYRIPQHERLRDQLSGLNHPPSACPYCRKRILAIDNIPIFGWLLLGGRCRFCRHSIPIRYALIELFNGLLWVTLYLAIVPAGFLAKIETSSLYSPLGALAQPNLNHPDIVWLVNMQYLYFLIMAEALLVATFIDFDQMIIPDGVTVPGMLVGLIGGTVLGTPALWPLWFFVRRELAGLQVVLPTWTHWMLSLPEQIPWLTAHPHWHGFFNSLLGLIVGGGTIWLVRIIGHWAFKREAIGFGDVTLMAMIGSFIGWQPSLMVFTMLAPFCAVPVTLAVWLLSQFSVSKSSVREIPFGPYLSIGALLIVLYWNRFFSHFDAFFGRGPFLLIMIVFMCLLLFPTLILTRLLMRLVRSTLGIQDEWDEPQEVGEWTSGDHLTFYHNKDQRVVRADMLPTNWWSGTSAGQGHVHNQRWRGLR